MKQENEDYRGMRFDNQLTTKIVLHAIQEALKVEEGDKGSQNHDFSLPFTALKMEREI